MLCVATFLNYSHNNANMFVMSRESTYSRVPEMWISNCLVAKWPSTTFSNQIRGTGTVIGIILFLFVRLFPKPELYGLLTPLKDLDDRAA